MGFTSARENFRARALFGTILLRCFANGTEFKLEVLAAKATSNGSDRRQDLVQISLAIVGRRALNRSHFVTSSFVVTQCWQFSWQFDLCAHPIAASFAQAGYRRPVGQELQFPWMKQPAVRMKRGFHEAGSFAFPRATAR